jgi:hypothetical protein
MGRPRQRATAPLVIDLTIEIWLRFAKNHARRYALFTLVGNAGEDDLDAPDLPMQSIVAGQAPSPQTTSIPSWRRKKARTARNAEKSERRRDQLPICHSWPSRRASAG